MAGLKLCAGMSDELNLNSLHEMISGYKKQIIIDQVQNRKKNVDNVVCKIPTRMQKKLTFENTTKRRVFVADDNSFDSKPFGH